MMLRFGTGTMRVFTASQAVETVREAARRAHFFPRFTKWNMCAPGGKAKPHPDPTSFLAGEINRKKLLMYGVEFHVGEEYFNGDRLFIGFENNFDKKTGVLYNPAKGFFGEIAFSPEDEPKMLDYMRWLLDIRGGVAEWDMGKFFLAISQRRDDLGKRDDGMIHGGAYFLTHFEPRWADRIGRDKLAKSPAHKVETLPGGGVLIQHVPSVFEYLGPSGAKALADLEKLNDYFLGILPDWDARMKYLEQDQKELLDKKITFDQLLNS